MISVTFHIYTTVYLRNRNQNDCKEYIFIGAFLICVLLGVYIIFETLHTFSTCYQDLHVDLLIISPGELLLLIVAMLLEALTVRYIWPDTVFCLLLALEDKVRHL